MAQSNDAALAIARSFHALTVVWVTIIIMSVIFTIFLILFTQSLWGLLGFSLLGLIKVVSYEFNGSI